MTIGYPNGKKTRTTQSSVRRQTTSLQLDYAGRGMSLEERLNESNAYYNLHGIACIHKKPTPIQIVNVHYPKRASAVITEAYFQKPSTTDYNGAYRGRYIDFEAKETKNKTSFPLANIHEHQIEHVKAVRKQNGISFFIICFTSLQETYYIDSEHIIHFYENQLNGRKSIPLDSIRQHGILIPSGYAPPIDYLTIIEKHYFTS
ncbi:MAG: Holliday junction resolvase RecU [Bacilli bacterium]